MRVISSGFAKTVCATIVITISFALTGLVAAAEAPGDLLIDNNSTLLIDHSTETPPSDSFELNAVFTNNDQSAEGSCDGDDPVTQGLILTLGTGTCGSSTEVVSITVPSLQGTGTASGSGRHAKH